MQKSLPKVLAAVLLISSTSILLPSKNTVEAAELGSSISEPVETIETEKSYILEPVEVEMERVELDGTVEINADVPNVIYASPTMARQKGYVFTTDAYATRAELLKLSDILDYQEAVTSVHFGIISALITAPLTPKFSIPIGVGAGLVSTFAKSSNTKIVTKALRENSTDRFQVSVTYTYKQVGSNDGYYYISQIKITPR